MTTSNEPSSQSKVGRDAANWARPLDRIRVTQVPTGAANVNVDGREVVSPMQGFGPLWQKTYRVRLSGVNATPSEVVRVWKENFPKFQPPENRFIPPLTGVKPGEVLFIDAVLPIWPGVPGGMPISAGVLVMYADEEMFTVMTPAGFPEAGWNTFSAYEEDGSTVAQVQSLARTNDPIFEFGFRYMGGARQQEKIWAYVLTQLAAHFGVKGQVQTRLECIDTSLQWRQAKNVFQNAIILTMVYKLTAPLRWIRGGRRR